MGGVPVRGHHSFLCQTCSGPKPNYNSINCRYCYEAERTRRAEARRNRPKRPVAAPWSETELSYLIDNYAKVATIQIATALGRSLAAIYQRASAMDLESYHQRGRISARSDYFARLERPVQAYILGLLMADGWITKLGQLFLSLNEKDVSAVELVRDELAPAASIARVRISKSMMARFNVQCPPLSADLARLGVRPAKTFTIAWPDELPFRLENSFVLGYFDGDGAISFQRGRPRWAVTCGSLPFLISMLEHIDANIGRRPGGPYRDKRSNAYSIVATGEPAREINEWAHRNVGGLDRKRFSH